MCAEAEEGPGHLDPIPSLLLGFSNNASSFQQFKVTTNASHRLVVSVSQKIKILSASKID